MVKDIIVKAYSFSEEKHKGQMRRFSNLPYFSHPKYVARVIEHLTKNPQLVATALLHDVVEDTKTSLSEIHDHFGSIVAMMVHELTNNRNDPLFKENKGKYIAHKMVAMTPGALTVKLADRFHNVLFLENDNVKVEFKQKYWKETTLILNILTSDRSKFNDAQMALINRIRAILRFLEIRYNW